MACPTGLLQKMPYHRLQHEIFRQPCTCGLFQAGYPSKEVKKIAKDITARCLRRWDGFLAVRAGTDSLGRKKGVWKDKFESVRCAVMLLAFCSVNTVLQRQVLRSLPGAPEPPV